MLLHVLSVIPLLVEEGTSMHSFGEGSAHQQQVLESQRRGAAVSSGGGCPVGPEQAGSWGLALLCSDGPGGGAHA